MRPLPLVFPALLLLFSLTAAADVPLTAEVIRGEAGVQRQSAGASDGESFFVAWEQLRSDADVVGSRVSASGEPLDLGGIPIQPTWRRDYDPAVVFNGSTYVVVFATEFYGVKVVEITRGGEVVTEKSVVEQGGVLRARIAWNGSEYLLGWTDGFTVRAVKLDRAFERVGEPYIAGTGYDFAIASNGTGFLVTDARAIASNGVSYAIARKSEVAALDESGNVTTHTPLPVADSPAIVWDGVHYLVAWSEGDRIFGAELDAALHVTRGPARLIAGEAPQRTPSLATSGARTLLTWSDDHIHAAVFERGAFAEPAPSSSVISTGLSDQAPLDAVRADGALQVLWLEDNTLYFAGRPLAPVRDARVAWNGSAYAILSLRGFSIELERFSASGEPLGPPMRLGPGSNPRIASNGRDFAAAWNDDRGNVFAIRFTATGAMPFASRFFPSLYGTSTLFGIVPKDDDYALFYLDSNPDKARTFAYFSAGFEGTPAIVAGGAGVYGPYTGAVGSNGHEVAYLWSYPGSNGVRARVGDEGPELVVSDALSARADAVAWEGATPLFLYTRPFGRFLQRGAETIEVPLSTRFVLVPGAYVYAREVDGVAGLNALGMTRAWVRFLTGTKRRAAR